MTVVLNENVVSQNIDTVQKLCNCIISWQKETQEKDQSIEKFNWEEIKEKMIKEGENLTSEQCCHLWKYIAYGKSNIRDVFNYESDEDDKFYQPLTAAKYYNVPKGFDATSKRDVVSLSLYKNQAEEREFLKKTCLQQPTKILISNNIGRAYNHLGLAKDSHTQLVPKTFSKLVSSMHECNSDTKDDRNINAQIFLDEASVLKKRSANEEESQSNPPQKRDKINPSQ